MEREIPIQPNEAHVWFSLSDSLDSPAWVESAERLLQPPEQSRYRSFASPRLRRNFLATRCLIRRLLSGYDPQVDPEEWIFTADAHGRPTLAFPRPRFPIAFNLSNTGGLIACAITLDRRIGVDVEHKDRRISIEEVAEFSFSAAEAADLSGRPVGAREARFFEYWTLKEAYAKARGLGLSLPFEQIVFTLGPDAAVQAAFGPAIDDDPRRWQFTLHYPTPSHPLALAVETAPESPVKVALRAFEL